MFSAVDAEKPDPVKNLHIAFDLFEAGLSMMRQKCRREHPEWDDERVDQSLDEWLLSRKNRGSHSEDDGLRARPL